MPRIPRSRLGEGVFHVLNRGINRSAIFGEEGDKKAFFDLLVEYRRRFAVRVLHWVIMIAWLIRKRTVVQNRWIACRLSMGAPAYVSMLVKKAGEMTGRRLVRMRKKLEKLTS